MPRPVTVLAAGGTIAMAASESPTPHPGHRTVRPSLDAAAIVASTGAEVASARSIRSLPSVHLTAEDALAVAREAVAEAEGGSGVVLTSGTDTLEELAVLVDALNGAAAPVVLTGAMRPASAPGADGPANVVDAVSVAAAAPGGTYVVFAGEVHAAREARKVDSTAPGAFASPRTGPLGSVAEGRVKLDREPPRPAPLAPEHLDAFVPIVPTWLADDARLLDATLALGPDALVLVALGAGHVSPAVLRALAGAPCPVAVTVRPERGQLLHATYGFEGAEGDVRATGAIPAGTRSPQAARMVLLAALGAGLEGAALAAAVADPA